MTGNLVYFLFSYEIRIVDCLFNVFIFYPGPCDHFLEPFRGSCCVKITKNSSKSTFLKLFDLIMTGNFVYFYFHIKIFILGRVTHIWTLSGGCVMSKCPISTFLAPFDILFPRYCRETPASLACFICILKSI